MTLPGIFLNTITIKNAPLADKFALASRFGFSGLEMWAHEVAPQVLSEADVREGHDRYQVRAQAAREDPAVIRGQAERAGLVIDGVIPGADVLMRWSDRLDRPLLAALGATIRACAALGGRYVVMPTLGERGPLGLVAENLRDVGHLAREHGVHLGLEPMGHCRVVDGVGDALEVLDMAALGDTAGIILDAFHFFRAGQDLTALSQLGADQIVCVQINDAVAMPVDSLFGHRHRDFPGHGMFDIAGFCDAVRARGYTGPFTVEILNPSIWSQPPEQVCERAFAASAGVLAKARHTGVPVAELGSA